MIDVFSKKKIKPHKYGFVELGEEAEENTVGFNPIEFSISPDGKTWTSCYDVKNMDGILCYSSPNAPKAKRTNNTKTIGFQDGERLISSSFASRELKFKLFYDGVDVEDAMLAFESAQRFLVARDAYWITFSDWQDKMYYGLAEMGDPEYTSSAWTCEVTFTDLMGLSRSIGTSLSPVEDMWGVNNNIPNNGDYPAYKFSSSSFTVYNPSDIMIDPERRGHEFTLVLNGSSGGNFKITNKTTGDYISRKDGFSGTWKLEGCIPTLNDNGDQKNITGTHGGVIKLQIEKNEFQVENFSGNISFDFPFWWLA